MRDQHHLKRSVDFRRVYGARHRRDGRLLVVYSLPNRLAHARVGFSVSTKVGGAVVRNLVKRRLRAASHEWLQEAGSRGVDLVIVARPEAAAAAFGELRSELRALFEGLATMPPSDLDASGHRTAP